MTHSESERIYLQYNAFLWSENQEFVVLTHTEYSQLGNMYWAT